MRRLRVYIEPRDLWIGVYVARDAVYVCPLPTIVIRWRRRQTIRVIDRAEFYRAMREIGAFSANDIRDLENRAEPVAVNQDEHAQFRSVESHEERL